MQIVFVRDPAELLGVYGHWDRARNLADKCLELEHVMEGLDGRQREIGNARSALQNDARAYTQMRGLKTTLGVLLADIANAREKGEEECAKRMGLARATARKTGKGFGKQDI